MPLGSSLVRTADYLTNHIGMENRVSNLETGVHPTTSDVDYFDSTVWTMINRSSGFSYWVTGLVQRDPYWRKRVGIVSLRGGVQPQGSSWPNWDEDASGQEYVEVATLPVAARPVTTMRFLVALTDAPYVADLEVTTDGKINVLKGIFDGSTPGRVGVVFDGVMWVPGDH